MELLFPEIFNKIDWEIGTESLDKELLEIQKDIFDKDGSEKIISDKIIDVETIELKDISNDSPLKLVFEMAKRLLETGTEDEAICDAKIKLAKQLSSYDKVKNDEQAKALVDFLEYLFLIQDSEIEKKYEEYKKGAH